MQRTARGDRSFGDALMAAFGAQRVRGGVPLAPYTTFQVGGPADWLLEVGASGDVLRALELARTAGVGITLLGGGSNVLVADAGIRGLVIRLRGGGIAVVDARRIRADGGASINGLIRWTIARGLAGLEAWAGTPGTVGGGIYGNAHFRGRMLGDLVVAAGLATRDGNLVEVRGDELAFSYDASRLQRTGEILIWADFRVGAGDPAMLRQIARQSLAFRKATQPLGAPSAGCIFRNPDPLRERLPPNVPASAGALIDRAGVKGVTIGGARVSPTHANFIVNTGGATAADIRALIERCRQQVWTRFGVRLREEIVYLGDFAGANQDSSISAE